MFGIIYVSEDGGAVIAVTPPDATPESTDVRCYVLREIGPADVLEICSKEPGAKDRKPSEVFSSLDEIAAWLSQQKAVA